MFLAGSSLLELVEFNISLFLFIRCCIVITAVARLENTRSYNCLQNCMFYRQDVFVNEKFIGC